MFFFEKKNQKTFAQGARAVQAARRISQSFLLLFYKKAVLASCHAFACQARNRHASLPVRRAEHAGQRRQ